MIRSKGFFTSVFTQPVMRGTAALLVITITCQLCIPLTAKALTSGPTQPEVQSFSPVGTSDMVNMFSGDFSYNIPLLDVDGYPINISYSSGITMDDEASWVGLGWNINAGVINRNMRGVPDEFNGDAITKETNMKPNRTFGLTGALGLELFGVKKKPLSGASDSTKISLSSNFKLGFNYNNYRGMGVELSANLSLSASAPGVGSLGTGLGVTSSSESGLTLQPSLSFSAQYERGKKGTEDHGSGTLNCNVGTAINSRSGMKQLSISASNSFVKDYENKNKQGGPLIGPGASNLGTMTATSKFSFGNSSYTPSGGPNMHNLSITGNFKFGGSFYGTDATYDLGGYYSSQKLQETNLSNPAYGYMNHEQGLGQYNALFDFNRENDGSFTQNTPALALAQQTFDMYNVSGQGVGGSYRVVRSDYSYVYDAGTATTSDGYDIGVELGTGGLFKVGGDLTVTANNSTSGMWDEENNTKSYLKAHASTSTRGYEKFYFKEANEKTIEGDEFYSTFGSNKAARVELQDNGDFNVVAGNRLQLSSGGYVNLPASNTRSKREKRNQVMYALTKYEVANGAGIEPLLTGSYAQTSAPNHHIAEIITYSNDGSRYVYGLPAYNTSQKDITFAVGARLNANDGATGDCSTGLVPYNTSDNSLSNDRGIDNYYSATTTPAYAHSYLLTSVLSAEYIDSDGQQGPTDHDLGYYTKFYYERISGYKWRTPYTASTNEAGYNEGIKTDANDDKANIIYGEKEIYYLDSIVTKNYIAIFHKSNRQDGYEAAGENGGVGTKTMKKLDKISLYSRWDYRRNPATAVPLKEVHFVYDYSLCDGVPNNPTGGGKLTLKEIYFTYQNSQKAKFSAYEFEYNGLNPNYAFKANDRWGNYKAIPGGAGCGNTGNLAPAEFPYVIQDSSVTNDYVSAWLMTDINLPSGGKIHVQYESDDYAYVQNKKASQMFRIEGYQGQSFPSSETDARNITAPGKRIYFALQDDITDMSKYFGGMERVYFRFLMETNSGHHDYVSGYFNIASYGTHDTLGETYGYVIPQSVDINDAAASADVNPITKAAVQYCRLNLPRHIYDQPAIDDGDSFGEDLLNSLVSVVSNFSAAVQGENKWILTKGKCEDAILKKSWIRLYNPTAKKLGGGVRVKKIVMSDEWANMTDSTMSSANYGQEYEYTLEDGTSSGVAAWEPQLGGDENTWKQPIFTNEKNLLAPDTEHYVEEPFGEGFFPGASVGYSRVTVKNLARSGVTKHATGKVVHEFFTAKNFPTIVENTKVKSIQDKTDPFSIASMFYVKSKDFMNASQGFYIELNDMHGKEKKQSVYQEGKTDPITSVEYKYKTDPYLTGSYRLNNNMKVVEPDGSISNKNIGLVMDMLTDFRQQRTELNSAATMCNLDGFIWPFPPTPIAIPVFLPSITHEVTQFRSAVVTKVVQRFGILEETIAKDLGSIVSTKNIAWDSETGEVLLTQTKTDFNDAIYSMSYPAHWYYDNMGQAYKNIGLTQAAVTFTAGNASISNANQYFTPGDVLQLKNGSTFILVWVVSTTSSGISVVKKDGSTFSGSYSFKIIRSGRKNLQSTPIATITSLSNPLTNFNANVYDKVLQASAVEFSDRWRTFCDCFDEPTSPMTYTNNPYILGTRGNWRMKTSFLHLSPRTQSMYNNNTNIRKDGTFVSFTPYYRLNTGKWQVDEKNWTYTSSVTEYSPYGQELENQDALGRYSTATFGYRQSFATAVAANSRYRDLGFDNFEDYGFSKCADNHFKFNVVNHIVDDDSHSGRRSIQISQGQPLTMKKVLTVCDPAGCSIEITTSAITNGKQAVVSGGDEPYQVDWNVINGAPVVSFSGTNFNALNITGPGSKIELIILDAKGCKLTKQINL